MIYKGLENEADQKILKKRAQDLSKRLFKQNTGAATSFLAFSLGLNEKYAISYEKIERVDTLTKLTNIPGISSCFTGIVYHNASVLPVLNLGKLLGICEHPSDETHDQYTQSNIIILNTGSHRYALSVKYVIGYMQLDVSNIHIRPGNDEKTSAFISGVCQSDITIIDEQAIIDHINLMSFE